MNVRLISELNLEPFIKDIGFVENRNLDLIFDEKFDEVCTYDEYKKHLGMISWKCAICGKDILIDTNRDDVENFVCDECKKLHNNKNIIIDMRILNARTDMYKRMIDDIYIRLEEELVTRDEN